MYLLLTIKSKVRNKSQSLNEIEIEIITKNL